MFFNFFACSNFKTSIFSIFRFKIFCKCWRWASCQAAIFLNIWINHEDSSEIYRRLSTVDGTINDLLRPDLKLTSNFRLSSAKLFSEKKNLTFSGALSSTFSVRLRNSIRKAKKQCFNDPNPNTYLPCFLHTTQTWISPPLQHFEQARCRHCVALIEILYISSVGL